MDNDSPIEAQRKLIAEIRTHLGREELILEGMERMEAFAGHKRAATPSKKIGQSAHLVAARHGATRGRQPGAISKRWRTIFDALVLAGNRFGDDTVVDAVIHFENRTMRRSEVRRLFENHRANDLVSFNADGSYSVTEFAIEKFGLGQKVRAATPTEIDQLLGGSAALKEDEPRSGNAGGSSHGRPEAIPFRRPWETHPTVQG